LNCVPNLENWQGGVEARGFRVEIFFEKIDNRTFDNGIMKEETLKAIEEIIQDVITVASGDSCGQPLCKNSE
jgi:hypothetical protein